MATIIRTAKYISTEVDENKNRFWYAYEQDDCSVKVEWGRVGNASQTKVHSFVRQNSASLFFDKKCREKEGLRKGYRKLQVIDNDASGAKIVGAAPGTRLANLSIDKIAKDQIETSCPTTKKLIDLLIKANVHTITSQTTIQYNANSGAFTTTLGIVTQGAIDLARLKLGYMTPFVKAKDFRNRQFLVLLNDYLMLIPQNVGRKLDPTRLYPDVRAIRTQGDILDSLEASLGAVSATKTTEKVFDVKLKLVEDAAEIKRIQKKYKASMYAGHECAHLDVKTIYDVEIGVMKAAYEAAASKIGNIEELWHGTRKSNLLSILSKGLMITKTYATARLFGDGVYFANRSTKSLNYAYGFWDGGSRDESPFMFLANVALGKQFIAKNCDKENYPVRGYDSVYGKANQTSMGYSGPLMNDEFIIYNSAQCNLIRLIEFSPGGK